MTINLLYSINYISDCDCYLEPLRDISAPPPSQAAVFGPYAQLAEPPLPGIYPRVIENLSLTGSYVYEILVLVIFILFCYIIYNFRSSIGLLFTALIRKKASTEKLMGEKSQFFRQFALLSYLLGILLISGMLIRVADALGLAADIPGAILPWVVPLVIGIVALIAGYRMLVVEASAYLTESQEFFRGHGALIRLFSIAGFLAATPLFLLAALNSGAIGNGLLRIIVIGAGILYLLFLQKSYRFFRERKVSTLQWILYLCAVEFFPVSFFVLLGMKYA